MAKKRVAVFASGSGSNFEAVVSASVRDAASPYEVALLVCDKPGAGAIERAERLGVPVYAVRPKSYASREAYEADVVRELRERGIDFIVLAGYMRLVTSVLLDAFENRILNIHPSLLPAFPGLHAVEQALAYGAKVAGVTVHFVDGGMDSGAIIAQEALAVLPDDTADTLYPRVQVIEHRLYPAVVRAFAEDRVRLDGRRVVVEGGLGL
ncbi:phosphoribosylglycinamide formyltransferase [Paenibacillus sp.]|uniref:phosphoribosylglycinamide formyltransferase n=1 Tax=Paenibacillus sp. TaxID=58172 RepID=UPI002D6255C6|nr:phosphoribosylglycinamide formyltransferase [Paenibacillus sp.]HZG88305.1 phosphoribosylglycinamide formyltransferase [Paenibacillus sp.]